MCGRLSQALPAELLIRLFGVTDVRREVPPPSWNVAPMQSVTVVARDAPRLRRVVFDMEWGPAGALEGHWETARVRPSNARCQTIMASGMFKAAFRKRRCLVAADCWYEWKREAGGKTPHALARSDGRPTVLGGIWGVLAIADRRPHVHVAIVTRRRRPKNSRRSTPHAPGS